MTDLDPKVPKPKVVTRYTCEGCPCLKTKGWSFEGENYEWDSGTDATCTATGRVISSYWYTHHDAPSWCPALAALPSPPVVVPEEALFDVFGQEAIDAAMENERTAQQFRDDLVASPSPPALGGAGRDGIIEECIGALEDAWTQDMSYPEAVQAISALKETL